MAGNDDDLRVDASMISVAENYQLYGGLDAVLERIEQVKTTSDIKSSMTVALLEMDSALHAFADGDKDKSQQYYARMLGHFHDVFRQEETLTGKSEAARAVDGRNVSIEVRDIFKHLTVDAIKPTIDANAKLTYAVSWGETLKGVIEMYAARQLEKANKLTLGDYAAPISKFSAETDPDEIVDTSKLSFARSTPHTPAPPVENKTTRWCRDEYKNLGTVLQHMSKPGWENRKDVRVALACVQNLNRLETSYIEPSKETSRSARDYRETLAKAVKHLMQDEALNRNIRGNLDRFYKPLAARAEQFEKLSAGKGLLSKIFHKAAELVIKAFTPAPKPLSLPKPQKTPDLTA